MNDRFEVEVEGGLTCVRFRGDIVLSDLRDAVGRSSAFATSAELWDFTAAEVRFDPADLRGLAANAQRKPRRPLRVAIVGSDDLGYGLVRLYAGNAEEDRTQLECFRATEEALAWLG